MSDKPFAECKRVDGPEPSVALVVDDYVIRMDYGRTREHPVTEARDSADAINAAHARLVREGQASALREAAEACPDRDALDAIPGARTGPFYRAWLRARAAAIERSPT